MDEDLMIPREALDLMGAQKLRDCLWAIGGIDILEDALKAPEADLRAALVLCAGSHAGREGATYVLDDEEGARTVDIDAFIGENRDGLGIVEVKGILALRSGDDYAGGGGAAPAWRIACLEPGGRIGPIRLYLTDESWDALRTAVELAFDHEDPIPEPMRPAAARLYALFASGRKGGSA